MNDALQNNEIEKEDEDIGWGNPENQDQWIQIHIKTEPDTVAGNVIS